MSGPPRGSDADGRKERARRADQECDRFEAAWKTGQRPRIEDHLAALPEPERPAVLRELILLEVDYRRLAGEQPPTEEFLVRFPALDRTWIVGILSGDSKPATRLDLDGAPPGTVPRRLGKFLLLQRLGAGGCGMVWRARDTELDRVVAIKIPNAEFLTEPVLRARFQREARAVARLSHPNVVALFDVAEADQTPFLVMEYLEGTDLGGLVVQAGPLAVPQGCDYTRQAALGLQHAHERGLVHRDIKPANLFLTAQGIVKVLDLGLARWPRRLENAATFLTEPGCLMGTIDFMAPEQARDAHAADARADIYSLGCTLCYLLTGQPPFAGGTPTDRLVRHQTEEPAALDGLRLDVPEALAAVVRRMLRKDPAARFQTPAEVAAALEPFAVATSTPGPSPAGPRSLPVGAATPTASAGAPAAVPRATVFSPAWHRGIAATVLLVVVGGIVLLVLALSSDRSQPTPPTPRHAGAQPSPLDALPVKEPRAPGQPPGLVQVLGNEGPAHWGPIWSVAVSPDGQVAASGGADGVIRLWKPLTLEPLPGLPDAPDHLYTVAFAPGTKSRILATAGLRGEIRLWDLADLEKPRARQVLDLPKGSDFVNGLAFSDGGHFLVGVQHQNVWRYPVKNPLQKPLRLSGHTSYALGVALTPDGRYALSGGQDRSLRCWDFQAAKELEPFLDQSAGNINSVAFSADGSLALSAGLGQPVHLWQVGMGKGTKIRSFGEPKGSYFAVAFAANDKQVLAADENGRVWLWDRDSGQEFGRFEVARHGRAVMAVAVVPRGGGILVGGLDGTLRRWSGGPGRMIDAWPGGCGQIQHLSFAADRVHLASGGRDQAPRLWNVVTGTERKRFAFGNFDTYHDPARVAVALSPDGQRLFGGSADGGSGGTLALWDCAKQQPLKHYRDENLHNVMSVALSADGRRALTGSVDRLVRLWDVETGKVLHRFHGHNNSVECVAFSPNELRLISGSKDNTLRLWDVDGRKEVHVFKGHEATVWSVQFSPDRRRALSGSKDRTVRLWDVDKGNEVAQSPKQTGEVVSVAFSSDGKTAASADDRGGVVLWDATVLRQRWRWQAPGPVLCVAFAPDGRHLATGNGNGTVYIIRLPPP